MADKKGEIEYTSLVRENKLPEGFLESFYQQLEKDLHQNFSRGSLRELQQQIATCLGKEMEDNRLEQLLYRIDLSEDYAAECMAAGNPLMCLAEALLKTEAVKVAFRLQHAGR